MHINQISNNRHNFFLEINDALPVVETPVSSGNSRTTSTDFLVSSRLRAMEQDLRDMMTVGQGEVPGVATVNAGNSSQPFRGGGGVYGGAGFAGGGYGGTVVTGGGTGAGDVSTSNPYAAADAVSLGVAPPEPKPTSTSPSTSTAKATTSVPAVQPGGVF